MTTPSLPAPWGLGRVFFVAMTLVVVVACTTSLIFLGVRPVPVPVLPDGGVNIATEIVTTLVPTRTATPTVAPTAAPTATAVPTSTATPTLVPPTPMAVFINRTTAFDRAFKDCVPIAQGAPENLTPLINEEEQDKMLGLLSPFGEVKGFYDDDFTHKACLFASGDWGDTPNGTIYFVAVSLSGDWEVVAMQWAPTP